MKRLPLAALAIAGIGAALPAAAQFQKPEDAIKYRKAAMTLQGATFGRVAAMANGRVPFDAKVAAENIEFVAMLNQLQFSAFVEGSDKGDTRVGAAQQAGDPQAVGAVGQSCKACHDEFRKD